MDNRKLKAVVLKVVDNQLRDLNPPETKQTYDRLRALGYSRAQARKLIGIVVAAEVFHVMTRKELFHYSRFAAALKKLPAVEDRVSSPQPEEN